MPKFTVDTHLFRELGELLVGRDSTALIELIKNAYDADATRVTVYGESLSDEEKGFIKIVDDGTGMGRSEFEAGFLCIASRGKEQGDRRSKVFRRRFTGAKGIGRLAAHKLARTISIESVPRTLGNKAPISGVRASIDWDAVEKFDTLDQITGAIQIGDLVWRGKGSQGTTIVLQKLRRRWTQAELDRFISEVQTFAIPPVLLSVPKSIRRSGTLFQEPVVRDSKNPASTFEVALEGAFSPSAEYWQAVSDSANWVIEVDASASGIKYLVTPTAKTLADIADVEPQSFLRAHPDAEVGPFFQARIFIREGRLTASKEVQGWAAGLGGIRVFLEGFRVLPYGDSGNDWLSLDSDYSRRGAKFNWMEEDQSIPQNDPDAGLVILPNRSYFGGVFLTATGANCLRTLVNREGFVPEGGFNILRDFIREGVNLATRVRAATSFDQRKERKAVRSGAANQPGVKMSEPSAIPVSVSLPLSVQAVKVLATQAKEAMARNDYRDAKEKIAQVTAGLGDVTDKSDRMISEAAMIRILASVGTQMAAFVHEINSLLGMAEAVEKALDRLRQDDKLNARLRTELAKLQKSLADLRRNLERQASYLIDVVSPDARRRRSRQLLAERFDAACRLVLSAAASKGVSIANSIEPALKSPAMFPAELTTIFSNLLSNAVKAAEVDGAIRASSRSVAGAVEIVVENTGAKVEVTEAERWFKPFESTTLSVDPVLGQGMGLGLPITRNMLDHYGAAIRFVKPSAGFSTALLITFPA